MPLSRFNKYANAMSAIDAANDLNQISNNSFPHMEKQKRNKLWNDKKKLATISNSSEDFLAPEEVAKHIGMMLNG